MDNKSYCSLIHSGLSLNFVDNAYANKVGYRFCCLNFGEEQLADINEPLLWNNNYFKTARETNLQGKWDKHCIYSCKSVEDSGSSYRISSNQTFGVASPPGPKRLDVKLSTNCNLACQICSDMSSTLWYKILKDNNLQTTYKPASFTNEQIHAFMDNIDLSALEVIVFSGGETLLGNASFDFLEYIKKRRPDGNIQVSFQTNGTIFPNKKQLELLNDYKLVKLQISLDGIENRFNYLRWPANWSATTDNMFKLREGVGVNTMFTVEETFSIFNFYYKDECKNWVERNFAENRLGDKVNYTYHFATGEFSLTNLTEEYIDSLSDGFKQYFSKNKTQPNEIKSMIKRIDQLDKMRNNNWAVTFPEVYQLYSAYM